MGSTFLTSNQLINPDLSKTIMNGKVLFLFAATAILMSDGAPLRRERRSLGLIKLGAKAAATAAGVAAAKPLALGLLGKYALYKWLTSGTNAGITAEGGLGPLKKKLSAGFEYGVPEYGVPEAVAPGPDGEFWYEPWMVLMVMLSLLLLMQGLGSLLVLRGSFWNLFTTTMLVTFLGLREAFNWDLLV